MYDSIQIMSKARQNYSILFIRTVALGKGAETGNLEAGLSLIWLLLTWTTQFVETQSLVYVSVKKYSKYCYKAHVLKGVWECSFFPTEAKSQGPASLLGSDRACLGFPSI